MDVLSVNEELKTILSCPFVLDFTNEKFCLDFGFAKGVITGVFDLRLLTHRFPTHMLGRLGLFV